MAIKKIYKMRPALPVLGVGVTWLVYFLIRPLSFLDVLLCLYISLMVYLVLSLVIPKRVVPDPDEARRQRAAAHNNDEIYRATGNSPVDELQAAGKAHIDTLSQLQAKCQDPALAASIEKLKHSTAAIVEFVHDRRTRVSQARKFMDYYLPTAIKMLSSSNRIDQQGVAGENSTTIKGSVVQAMDLINAAAQKELDSLYADEALDISTDIDVLEQLVKKDGLTYGDYRQAAGKSDVNSDR